MPYAIQLTTPLNPGDLGNAVYDHVRVTRSSHDIKRGRISLVLEYGTYSGEDWVPADNSPSESSSYPAHAEITDAAYTSLVSSIVPDVQPTDPSDSDYSEVEGVWVEKTYVAEEKGYYRWLKAVYPSLAGTVV